MTETDAGIRVEAVKDKQARQTLHELCTEYRRLAGEAGALEIALKAVKADIDAMAKKARVKKILGDGWVVLKVSPKPSKSLKKELLLENGVSMDTIKASTVETPRDPYYTVRKADAD
jgi:hypothetical protein